MPSHPDADALLRNCLRNPTDPATRFAFADWLERTGNPAHIAWAHYIRLNAEIATCPPGSRRAALEAEVQNQVPHIRARLTVPAAVFVEYHESLQQLLPAHRFTVQLREFTPQRGAIELLTERIARVYRAFPLERTGSNLLLAAAADDDDVHSVRSDLNDFLGLPVIAVRGSSEEIVQAINAHYMAETPQRAS